MEEVNYPENVAYFYKHDKVAGIKRCILATASNYSNQVHLSKKSPPVLPESFKAWQLCPFGCIASVCSVLPPGRPLILSPLRGTRFSLPISLSEEIELTIYLCLGN